MDRRHAVAVLAVIAALLLGASPALAVSNVVVTNASPTNAAGGQTVYSVAFITGAALSRDAGDAITLVFPTGTTFAGYNGSAVYDSDSATPTTSLGGCSGLAGLTITCGLSFNQAIPAGHHVRIVLNGITNPPAGSPHLTAWTTQETGPVDSGPFEVRAANPVAQVAVDNSTPSTATGARTVYTITYLASATGGISRDANSAITLAFPTGTTFAGYNGSAVYDSDSATPTTSLGGCSGLAGLTITCGLSFNQAIPAGHHVRIVLNGITNPPAGSPHLTASTTSDPAGINSANYTVNAANPVAQVAVDNSTPSTATGARTVYTITYLASATGGISRDANSAITLAFPTGTTFAGYNGSAVYDSDSATPTTSLGGCSGLAGLTITCGLSFNQAIPAGHHVRIVLNGITNPPAGSPHLTASTTSDPAGINSANYTVNAANPVAQVAVDNSTPSTATGARTVYTITYLASATGGISRDANSAITLAFPTGTTFAGYNGSAVYDSDSATPTTSLGGCSGLAGLTITCGLSFNQAIPAGHHVRIVLNGITNPPAGSPHLTASTTSDPAGINSANYPVLTGQALSGVLVNVGSASGSALTQYTIEFVSSTTGGLSRDANSAIALVFPAGTALAGYNGSAVFDLTAGGPSIGACGGASGLTVTCGLNFGQSVLPGHRIRVTLSNVGNPPAAGNYTLTASTTSDAAAESGAYGVGADTIAPETAVTGGGASGSTATFAFGSSEPGSTFTCTLSGPGGTIGPEPCTSPKTYAGLGPGTYTFTVDATDPAGNPDPSPDVRSFSVASATPTPQPTVSPTPTPTPTATPPPAPEFHKDVVVRPVSGTVKVRLKGTNTFVDLASAKDIPLGSTIDVKAGKIQLSSVPKQGGKTETATFYGGVFQITQPGGITDLKLNEALAACPKGAKKASAAAKKKPKTRRLWGQGSGSFRTTGRYSAATVRGTKWLVQDSCSGTLTRVTQGVVNVRDNVRRKTIVVRAGHRYLAKPRR